jgi:hypothetical protein
MIPTTMLFGNSDDKQPSPQSVPRNLIYFLKAGTDPKEYIERAIAEAYPDWKQENHTNDGYYELLKTKTKGKFTVSAKKVYVKWEIFDRLTIVFIEILSSYVNVHMNTLAFAYSFDQIIRKSGTMIEG